MNLANHVARFIYHMTDIYIYDHAWSIKTSYFCRATFSPDEGNMAMFPSDEGNMAMFPSDEGNMAMFPLITDYPWNTGKYSYTHRWRNCIYLERTQVHGQESPLQINAK